jgi:hypothetical protein
MLFVRNSLRLKMGASPFLSVLSMMAEQNLKELKLVTYK